MRSGCKDRTPFGKHCRSWNERPCSLLSPGVAPASVATERQQNGSSIFCQLTGARRSQEVSSSLQRSARACHQDVQAWGGRLQSCRTCAASICSRTPGAEDSTC